MTASSVPNDAYLLRLTSAIEAKSTQFEKYRERGYIRERDATVIAISAAKWNHRFNEFPMPRGVSAVLAAGAYTVVLNRDTRKITDHYHEYRENLKRLRRQ